VPCTKVTGKWLFPKAALDRWLAAGLLTPALAHAPAPPIVGGSHDPLLEWALRESASGLASLPEGSEAGLRRLARGEVAAAAIHLHRLDGDDELANCDAVASAAGLHDAVVIAVARREQGLVVAASNPLQLSDVASIVAKRARLALRPQGAGAQLLLLALVARAGIALDALARDRSARPAPISRRRCAPVAPTAGSRLAQWRRQPGSISCRSHGSASISRCASATISCRGCRRCSTSFARRRSATARANSAATT